MSIKRHPALQPFSRDHFVGLFHANQLIWLREGRARKDLPTTVANFLQAWQTEISIHFLDEERLLPPLPVSRESISRLLNEHEMLRKYVTELTKNPSIDNSYKLGRSLDDHIRWEEHHLFPEIEKALSEERLSLLQGQTNEVEIARDRKGKSCKP